MDKDRIKAAMLALSAVELSHANEQYAAFLAGSKPTEDEAVDEDEQAQTWTQAELADGFEQPVHDAEQKLAIMRDLDFSPKDRVEPGAVVCVRGRHFVIGISTDRFACDGIELMGLSEAAPFYQAIAGLSSGETGEFRGQPVSVGKIY